MIGESGCGKSIIANTVVGTALCPRGRHGHRSRIVAFSGLVPRHGCLPPRQARRLARQTEPPRRPARRPDPAVRGHFSHPGPNRR
ncbi:hypothetical protein [Corynebacterium kroppenstedtii]|uniref:hypothetical protein n=1 Tax=Corynebacterium kroppenstedtii TaxID=161879 RepID=UPI00234FFE44|nr:hypothetical protein [Corynebacterium kroppenstedtii]